MTPKKVFLAMLAALTIVVAIGGGVFYMIDGQLAAKAEEINTLKADVDILDQKIQFSQGAAQELEKYRDIESLLNDVLPPEKIQNDIVAEILDISGRNNASVNNISFPSTDTGAPDFSKSQTLPVDGVPGVLAVEIRLELEANFTNTLSLLDDFEKNQRKIQVASVNITPILNEDGSPTGNFSLNISINAYQRA